MTAMECYNEFLVNRGDVCLGDCGSPVLSCVNQNPDCFTCTEQCLPQPCTTNAECQQQFGDLCPGVTWICDQYQLANACTVDFGDGGGSSDEGACTSDAAAECDGDGIVDCQTEERYACDDLCIDAGFDGADVPACGPDERGEATCYCYSESAGCDGGDPYECSGDQLYDCAAGVYYDCDSICIDAGYAGVSDPACGVGDDGWDVCLCR